MKAPLGIIVVPGDGTRVLRFRVPRWVAWGAVGAVTTLGAGAVSVLVEQAWLERQRDEVVALRRRVTDQQAAIDAFQRRVASVRDEVEGWKTTHAKMWDALGGEPPATADVTPAATAGVGRQHADEIDRLSAAIAQEEPRLRELAQLTDRTGKIMEGLPLSWPVRGAVKSEFGLRRSPLDGRPEVHEGIDIGSPPGTPVVSPAAGVVTAAGGGGGYGKHVKLAHECGVSSLYGHLRKIDVKRGERVEKGQVLGFVGSTGRSTGPHLHYEVAVRGKQVDPRGFLSDR